MGRPKKYVGVLCSACGAAPAKSKGLCGKCYSRSRYLPSDKVPIREQVKAAYAPHKSTHDLAAELGTTIGSIQTALRELGLSAARRKAMLVPRSGMRFKVFDYLETHPEATLAEIGEALGCSHQRVAALCVVAVGGHNVCGSSSISSSGRSCPLSMESWTCAVRFFDSSQ